MQANYFQLQLPDNLVLYRYILKIKPRIDKENKPLSEPKGKKLKQIISLRLKNLQERLASRESTYYVATDYKSNLVCSTKIPQDLLDAEITYLHENDHAAGSNSPKYRVCIEETSPPLMASQLEAFLTSPDPVARYEHKEPMLQALNILFGHHAKSTPTTTMVGGNRAFTRDHDTDRLSLNAGVEAVRGYFLSVRLCSFSSMVNVNVSHSAFYEAVTLEDFIEKMPAAISRESEDAYYSRLETFLRGIHVKTKHLRDRSGNQITKVFSIKAFATPTDGRDQSHPPNVKEFAAQPSKVWFHLDDASRFEKLKGKLKKNYINVRDYFKLRASIFGPRLCS